MDDEERNYCVYMHTNKINNKKYIGITRQNPPEKRWGHNGHAYRENKHFSSAIQKYGWDNFKHEILFRGFSKKQAEDKEVELIAYYDCTNSKFGYNKDKGGRSAGRFTEDTIQKMRDAHKNIDIYWNRKPVLQYKLNGECVGEFEGVTFAAKQCGYNDPSIIAKCCKGILKKAYGYIWRYVDEPLTEEHRMWCISYDYNPTNKKQVTCYDMNGNFINTYDSVLQAERFTGADHSVIIRCCNNQCKTSAGYIWRYSDDDLTAEHIKWCNHMSGKKALSKPVVQFDMNMQFIGRYESITEAKRKMGVNNSCISQCCNGKLQTYGGYIWKFEDDVDNMYIGNGGGLCA